jgi:NitT/TauT family transport system substrate-binding protein
MREDRIFRSARASSAIVVAKIGIKIATLLLVVFGQSSCSRPDRGAAGDSEKTPLRVGYIPIADAGQLMVAVHLGLFARESLSVELVSLPGGARIIEAMNAGDISIGFSNLFSLLLARAQGLDYVGISGGPFEDSSHAEHAILVRKGTISSIDALKGKRIALNTRNNIDELMMRALLAQHGIDSLAVKFIEVPFPRMLSVLEAGDIDAAAAIEPFVTAGRANPRLTVLSYNYIAIQPTTAISTYVAHDSWVKANRQVAARFVRALDAATDSIAANPAILRAALARFTTLPDSILQRVVLPGFSKTIDSIALARLDQMGRRLGLLSGYDSVTRNALYSWH